MRHIPREHWFALPPLRGVLTCRRCPKCKKRLRITLVFGDKVWLAESDVNDEGLAPDHRYSCFKRKAKLEVPV